MKLISPLVIMALSLLGVSAPVKAQQQALRGRDYAKEQSFGGEFRYQRLRRNEQQEIHTISATPGPRVVPAIEQSDAAKAIGESAQDSRQEGEHLSPEERRQLRRDINAAGRDIYRRQKPTR